MENNIEASYTLIRNFKLVPKLEEEPLFPDRNENY